MAELSLENVEKVYGDAAALEDVSLEVRDGEFFTLVGPSGCGKTTTLRLVAGLETPTAGTIRFDGEDVSDVPPEDRDVGIVFQNYALFPHMTVAENVRYGLKFRDPPDGVGRDERVRNLLDLVDLSGMGDRSPDNLSGGQQQRVALARALAPAPEVLLLDEPMSALDARLREQLRRQVKRIQRELGVTTVYVTHDQEEALAISDRLAVLHDGEVEQVGTPPEVYESPAGEFVASFVGENNVFDGEVVAADSGGLTVGTAGDSFRVVDRSGARAVGDHVTFCVRPEDLSSAGDGAAASDGVAASDGAADADDVIDADADDRSADGSTNRLSVAVETVEYLGESTRVYGTWHGRSIVLRTAEPPAGDSVTVTFDPADATVL